MVVYDTVLTNLRFKSLCFLIFCSVRAWVRGRLIHSDAPAYVDPYKKASYASVAVVIL